MFCKVVKSVYICISKQVIRNLSVLAMNFGCWRDTQQRGGREVD